MINNTNNSSTINNNDNADDAVEGSAPIRVVLVHIRQHHLLIVK